MISECNDWIKSLRHYREDITELRNRLYQFAAGKTEKDILIEIDHFHNQFHLQLINIHDLKHEIKGHIQQAEHHPTFGHRIPHHQLEVKYRTLVEDLDKLEKDFLNFIG